MVKYVLVGLLLATLQQCVISAPQNRRYPGNYHHRDKPDKRTTVGNTEAGKVVWGGTCSPLVTRLYPKADVILECEVYVPAGTTLTWYKGVTPFHDTYETEMFEEATNEIKWTDSPSLSLSPLSRVHLRTVLFIDCASEQDKGEYTLVAKTPDGTRHYQYFTVTVLNKNLPRHIPSGATCSYGRNIISYLPRVYLYTKQVMAYQGYDVIVPCRSQGLETAREWSFDNKLIGYTKKHQVLADGDLLIRNVSAEDRGIYSCKSTSLIAQWLVDEVLTYFFPHTQDEKP